MNQAVSIVGPGSAWAARAGAQPPIIVRMLPFRHAALALLLLSGLLACTPTLNWREVAAAPTSAHALLPCKPIGKSRGAARGSLLHRRPRPRRSSLRGAPHVVASCVLLDGSMDPICSICLANPAHVAQGRLAVVPDLARCLSPDRTQVLSREWLLTVWQEFFGHPLSLLSQTG